MFLPEIVEIIFILLALALVFSLLVWRVAVEKKRCLLVQLASLSVCTKLKKLVDNIQQHRGMLNATLSGDNSFSTKITQTQKVIDTTFNELNSSLKNTELHKHLVHLNKAQQYWKNLSPTVLSLSKGESLKKHTALIQSILFLMTNIAEENQWVKDNSFPMELIDMIWHRIPNTTEALGKIRATGSGIAATGNCSAIDHIKVGFLIKYIKGTMYIVEKKLNKLQHDSSDNNKLFNSYTLIQSDIYDLLHTLEQKILLAITPQITAGLFFEQATACLGKVYGFFDQGESMINQTITVSLTGIEWRIKKSLFIMIFSLLATFSIIIFF
jgi:hypothetical protein